MPSESTDALAHVRQDVAGCWLTHSLEEHLRGVATLAGSFAAAFDAGDWAKLAGLWHDLGKYRSAFQRYIRVDDPRVTVLSVGFARRNWRARIETFHCWAGSGGRYLNGEVARNGNNR